MNTRQDKRQDKHQNKQAPSPESNIHALERPAPLHAPANDMNARVNPDYIQFQQFMRSEKRQSFWGGISLSIGVAAMLLISFLLLSETGINFMTCQEYGETFTCRFGGL